MIQYFGHLSPRAIIFDMDGLMVDSEPLAEWAWNQVLARYGHTLDAQTFRQILGMRVADSALFICHRFPLPITAEEALAERERLFMEAAPARLCACPGLYPLLDELAERGLPLGVATSGHRRYVTLVLRMLGIDRFFQAVVTGDEVARGKPAPDIYLLAAERLDVPPNFCLALEDAPLGVESACAAGMACVAVPNEWTASLEFPGAYRVFNSLNEVRMWVTNFSKSSGSALQLCPGLP
ncbi:MAG: HAD family phosphatase [Chloroflexota bacterium]|nr:HAD family phosphatase [Chloroflexota bacterium]